MASTIAEKLARYAPVAVGSAYVDNLSPGDRRALDKLLQVGPLLNELYYHQKWSGNAALMARLMAEEPTSLRTAYARINKSPWSCLSDGERFVDEQGVPEKQPPGAGFYPEDMSKEEFEAWLDSGLLSEQEKAEAKGFYHVIVRGDGGKLQAVPYSEAYRRWLEPAASLLRAAAAETTSETLRTFLNKRADSFLSNDYYDSDVAWMELDSPLEVTVGPYEVYQDRLFGYKAAFELFVTVRDEEGTRQLALFQEKAQALESALPMDDKYKRTNIGKTPIRVVELVFSAGDVVGPQTLAFCLPNDERVVREKGSKLTLLKNLSRAKFDLILRPIAERCVVAEQRELVTFDAFFTHVLCHECCHSIGPHDITVQGKPSSVRAELTDLHSALEEAKADIVGLWALQYLVDQGLLPASLEKSMYVSYLATAVRSVRFGLEEAHGKGIAVQFHHILNDGGFYVDSAGFFGVDFTKVKQAVSQLATKLLHIQAEGDRAAAKQLLDRYGIMLPAMQARLDSLGPDVPVDIRPTFALAEETA